MSIAREGLVFVAIAAALTAGAFWLALSRRSWGLWLLAFVLLGFGLVPGLPVGGIVVNQARSPLLPARQLAAAASAMPSAAIPISFLCMLAHSSGLESRASESNRPCASKSPGTGSKRLSFRSGLTGSYDEPVVKLLLGVDPKRDYQDKVAEVELGRA